jgi:tRNA dimethylallyltransferase
VPSARLSSNGRTRFLAILGPTASGKSALGLALAQRRGGEIVSCDSQQVYIGMDIGTAKPSRADRRAVPHHILDVVPPDEAFHAGRWVALARAAIKHIAARGKLPIVVGGTGLYYRVLTTGLFDAPPPDAAIRERHRGEAAALGVEKLHDRLAGVDPAAAAVIARRDLVRISRALEVHEQTGVPITELRRRAAPPDDLDPVVLVLDPAVPALRRRIEARVRHMVAAGLEDEVRALRAAGYGPDLRALQALGYKQMGDYIDGRMSLEQAMADIAAATVAYARRQRTWFRTEVAASRLPEAPPVEDIEQIVGASPGLRAPS